MMASMFRVVFIDSDAHECKHKGFEIHKGSRIKTVQDHHSTADGSKSEKAFDIHFLPFLDLSYDLRQIGISITDSKKER